MLNDCTNILKSRQLNALQNYFDLSKKSLGHKGQNNGTDTKKNRGT